ncbi:MAG TPA: RluA family pseudouridine synthase [Symbiobacteriaceae bacterium]|nr:RluA family pseudouridine synthase [Symbiobacteriaceae bacterium]
MRYSVPPEARGLSLGRFLYDRLKLSRTLVRRAKHEGAILVDGRPARVSDVLAGGEQVELVVPSVGRVAPEPVPIAVVYEDGDLLAVDKPPGMVVHPVKDYQQGTLAGGVAYHLQQRGEEPVARPVQRIDRETSGLVLFAKNPAAAGWLSRELEKRKLERRYVAFVHGEMAAEQGTVDVPLRRVWGHPVAREAALGRRTPEQEGLLAEAEAGGQVLREDWKATGQRAVTHWQVLRRWPGVTMLVLQLETGRTHQIRVHMAYLGHPLLGDSLYGSGGRPGRQALHAATLVFDHPVTGVEVRLESPLPSDLVGLMESLTGLPR